MKRALAVLCGLYTGSCLGAASLRVLPARVLLSDKKPAALVSLRHDGEKPGTYQISAVFYRMTHQGTLELVDKPAQAERSAAGLLKFSPTQVKLSPKKEKAVRIRFDGPPDLAEGEYRAHLLFTAVEPKAAEAAPPPGKAGELSRQMTSDRAVAVPVFYRKGHPEYKATLTNLGLLRLPDQTPAFRAELKTEGNAFPYGDLFVLYAAAGSTNPKTIGVTRGVAAYTDRRELQYPLALPVEGALAKGVLRVELRQPEDEGGALITFLEAPVQ